MKIYIAATFQEQVRMRSYRDELFKLGHIVTSSWLNEIVRPDSQTPAEFSRKMAMKDLQEIMEADLLILDREKPSTSGGKMIEYGFALAHHKKLWVVDPDAASPGSIFLRLADSWFDDWNQVFNALEDMNAVHQQPQTGGTGSSTAPTIGGTGRVTVSLGGSELRDNKTPMEVVVQQGKVCDGVHDSGDAGCYRSGDLPKGVRWVRGPQE